MKQTVLNKDNKSTNKNEKKLEFINIENYIFKPKLAFGYGYDPNILKNGIVKFHFSHRLKDGRKLYVFKPRISYKIYPILAKLIGYNLTDGSILNMGNTEIKSSYFITDKEPEKIINDINLGIQKLFQKFEPIPNNNKL